jgi:sugar phosphate isomerase/epimerase
MEECAEQGVKIVGVHGWVKLSPQTEDEEQWRFMVDESLSAIRFAEEVGASIYVAHFGCTEGSKRLVMELLDKTDGFRVRLTTENGRDLRPFMAAVDDIKSHRFGMIVDIGHTRDSDGVNPFVKKKKARQTLAQCGDRVFHVHLHEVFDQDQRTDHNPPLHKDGIVQWEEVFAGLRDIGYKGELVFEDGRGENPEEWVQMTGAFPRAFVQRYG